MGKFDDIPDFVPGQVATVGAMIAGERRGWRFRATCLTCGTHQKVDLVTIRAVRGERFSLVNQKGACRIYDCDGICAFYYCQDGVNWVPLVAHKMPAVAANKAPPRVDTTGSLFGAAHQHGPGKTTQEALEADRARREALKAREDPDKGLPAGGKGKRRR